MPQPLILGTRVGAGVHKQWAFQVHANFLMGTLTRSKTYIFIVYVLSKA